ncbi:hypothetical protein [Streptomyces sp. NPDC006879]|uniref:hypothetical protein n=1 Tax=Streptomyces sp. NPDC006879 TaxID=3364767 RepID=UPI0036961E4F
MPKPPATPVARAGAALRLLRAAVFAAVCVVLSASGHVLASRSTVPWWILGAGFLAVFGWAAALAGRRRSLPAIAATLAGGQLALHGLFGFGQHAAEVRSANASLSAFAASLVCGGPATLSPTAAWRLIDDAGINPAVATGSGHLASGPPTSMVEVTGLLSLPMLLAHLLTALLVGLLLSRGESALFRLLHLSAHGAGELAHTAAVGELRTAFALLRALHTGLPTGSRPGPVRTGSAPAATLPTGTAELQHIVIRRGPPGGLALAA